MEAFAGTLSVSPPPHRHVAKPARARHSPSSWVRYGLCILLERNDAHRVCAVLAQGGVYVDPVNGIRFVGYTDPVHSMTTGFVFPPVSAASNEYVGQIVAPIATKWAGVAPGGAMNRQVLIVAWLNGNSVVSSVRHSLNYEQPVYVSLDSLFSPIS